MLTMQLCGTLRTKISKYPRCRKVVSYLGEDGNQNERKKDEMAMECCGDAIFGKGMF